MEKGSLIGKTPYIILAFLTIVLLSGAFSIVGSMSAQKKAQQKKSETYTRPAPTKPIKPSIPDANRYQDDKVFLENADSLFRPGEEMEEKQIVKGNVKFRQGGMWMFCDSAYYFPMRNSMDAFGHVEMQQGDTLFVYADKLFYDGSTRHAILTSGPSQQSVVMKNREVKLTTDSLDYDLVQDLGWYAVGGRLEDGVNVLTSQYGQYSPTTKIAEFRGNVVLENNKDGYKMFTEELTYDTRTHEASITTETRIEGENDTILTSSGRYNTNSDYAIMTTRSTILHRDSSGNVITLEGDTLIHDKLRHISEARMKDRPMVLTDTARKMTLIGGYGRYNNLLQESMATDYPLLMEYSREDTLFLRSDTILTFMRTEMVWPDSLNHDWNAERREWLYGFKTIEEVDAWMDSIDSTPEFMLPLPGTALPLKGNFSYKAGTRRPAMSQNATGESPSSPAPSAVVPPLAQKEDSVAGKQAEVKAIPPAAVDSVDSGSSPVDSLPSELISGMSEGDIPKDTLASDSLPVKIGPRLDRLGRDSTLMVEKQFNAAKAIGRARFFKQDIQGIADTILYHQFDSVLYMRRKPVVWSGERQIFGDTIKVHFVDSVADWAYLPVGGMVIEHIDEDFYNQLSGSEIKALLKDNALDHLIVNGNVETIFLPMENDSTYNKLVHAESSYLTVDMDGKDMKKLKMWPDVDGTVSPIFLVKKKEDKFLQGFKWLEMLRPRRQWYGDRLRWEDELGEVPDELDQYFNN